MVITADVHRLVTFINTLHCVDGDDVLADERATGWLADWLGTGAARPAASPDTLTNLRACAKACDSSRSPTTAGSPTPRPAPAPQPC